MIKQQTNKKAQSSETSFWTQRDATLRCRTHWQEEKRIPDVSCHWTSPNTRPWNPRYLVKSRPHEDDTGIHRKLLLPASIRRPSRAGVPVKQRSWTSRWLCILHFPNMWNTHSWKGLREAPQWSTHLESSPGWLFSQHHWSTPRIK